MKMDLQCEVREYMNGHVYIEKATILQRGELQAINEKHGKQFSDIKTVTFKVSKIHYLPDGLHTFFPLLEHLKILGCDLKDIVKGFVRPQ